MNSMIKSVAMVCGFVMMSQVTAEPQQQGVDFDVYVLTQSWEPQFCFNKASKYPGCHNGTYYENHLTLHGMWPEYNQLVNGTDYPSNCATTPAFDPSLIDDSMMAELLQYWPNVQNNITDPDYTWFWEHEWSKHGLCTKLDQKTFMEQALRLEETLLTPDIIVNNVGKSVTTASVLAAYEKRPVLQCSGKVHLSAVMTCWSKDENDIPVAQVDCPDITVQLSESCVESTIIIQSF